MLGEFHKQHPQIELQLEIANTEDIQRLLKSGAVEIGLTEGIGEAEGLDSEVFHQDKWSLSPHPTIRCSGNVALARANSARNRSCCGNKVRAPGQ